MKALRDMQTQRIDELSEVQEEILDMEHRIDYGIEKKNGLCIRYGCIMRTY